jgi:hypothetical protein
MPAWLAEKDFERWLGGEAGIELLKPAADDFAAAVAGVETRQQLKGACRRPHFD